MKKFAFLILAVCLMFAVNTVSHARDVTEQKKELSFNTQNVCMELSSFTYNSDGMVFFENAMVTNVSAKFITGTSYGYSVNELTKTGNNIGISMDTGPPNIRRL